MAERLAGSPNGSTKAEVTFTHHIEIPSPQLLWTTNKNEQTQIIDNVLRNNNPFYYAIASILNQEGTNLRALTNERIRHRQAIAQINNQPMDDWGKKNTSQRALADAYVDLFEELRWAKMLDETNGDIKNHPDFIDSNKPVLPEIDNRLVIDINIYRAEQEENQRVLRLIREDPSGFQLLDLLEKQRLERQQKVGWDDDPKSRNEFTGFQKAIDRYKELYKEHLGLRIPTQTMPLGFS